MYDEAGHIQGEYTSSGALIQETVWMGDTPVATLYASVTSPPFVLYYVHTDHLNTPRKVTSPLDNSLKWRWDPDTFGSTAPVAATFVYNLRFPGMYALPESGLFNNSFRDFDPQMGRYIESDPIGLAGGVNTYAYVGSNPLSRIDPFGLAQCDVNDMVALARRNNPDINIPMPSLEPIPNNPGGDVVAGETGIWPWSIPVVNSALYGGTLSIDERIDLYNTIVHESWHYDRQPFYNRHSPASEREAYRVGDTRAKRDAGQIRHGTNSCGCSQ